MVRTWNYEDPDPDIPNPEEGPFTVVRYKKPQTEEEKQEISARRRERHERIKEIMSDPITAYEYEKAQYELGFMRRLARLPENSDKSFKQLRSMIRGAAGQEYVPVMLLNPKNSKNPETVSNTAGAPNKKRDLTSQEQKRIERNAEEGCFATRKFDSDFIKNVVNIRLRHNMTQEDLAEMVHMTVNDIVLFEKGELRYSGALKSLLTWKLGRLDNSDE